MKCKNEDKFCFRYPGIRCFELLEMLREKIFDTKDIFDIYNYILNNSINYHYSLFIYKFKCWAFCN